MKKYVVLIISLFIISCQKKENKVIPEENKTSIEEKDKVIAEKTDDIIHLNSIDEKGKFTVEGELDSVHPRSYIKFENDDLGKLKAKIIITSGKGNIRFNQIIMPDNSSDGPFGMELNTSLTQKGKHILVVGHSQMADFPYMGKFQVELQIN